LDLIADILLISGALGACIYCFVLSRRLRRFGDVEKGVGGAIATLSEQVDQMTAALGRAQSSAVTSARSLDTLTGRAEDVARRLELLVASMHDLSEAEPPRTAPPAEPAPALFQTRRAGYPEAAE
jgi:methyl-accepting chemotaxis protein